MKKIMMTKRLSFGNIDTSNRNTLVRRWSSLHLSIIHKDTQNNELVIREYYVIYYLSLSLPCGYQIHLTYFDCGEDLTPQSKLLDAEMWQQRAKRGTLSGKIPYLAILSFLIFLQDVKILYLCCHIPAPNFTKAGERVAMPEDNIAKEIMAISTTESELDNQLKALERQNPDVFKQIKAIEQARAEVQKLKDAVKAKLIENKDFDLHEVGDLRVSVSAVANVKVVDIDQVSDDFKEVKTVADIKKAKEYLKVMKRVPEGFEDASFYRLNWRITDETVDN